jgi:hypothetical protein
MYLCNTASTVHVEWYIMCNICNSVGTFRTEMLESVVRLNPPNLLLPVTFLITRGGSCTCKVLMVLNMKNSGGTEVAEYKGSWRYNLSHICVGVSGVEVLGASETNYPAHRLANFSMQKYTTLTLAEGYFGLYNIALIALGRVRFNELVYVHIYDTRYSPFYARTLACGLVHISCFRSLRPSKEIFDLQRIEQSIK